MDNKKIVLHTKKNWININMKKIELHVRTVTIKRKEKLLPKSKINNTHPVKMKLFVMHTIKQKSIRIPTKPSL